MVRDSSRYWRVGKLRNYIITYTANLIRLEAASRSKIYHRNEIFWTKDFIADFADVMNVFIAHLNKDTTCIIEQIIRHL